MGFIAWIVLGFIGGAIAKSIVGQSMGWIATLICGLIGGVVGGWIISTVTDGAKGMTSFFSIWSWAASIIGSVIVVWIVSPITGKRREKA